MIFVSHSKGNNTLYYIEKAVLDKVKTILDLGMLLDHRLNFRDNISLIVNKAYVILEYTECWFKEFVDPYLTKLLFISLVLKYGSIIWDPC